MCTGDPGIEYASQAEAFESIVAHEKSYMLPVGPLLTVLCALMWLITGAHVCKHACLHGHTNARTHAWTQSLTKWQVSSDWLLLQLHYVVPRPCKIAGGKIESISTTRLVLFWASQTVRLAVAIMLAYGMQTRTPVDTHRTPCWQVGRFSSQTRSRSAT